MSRPRRAAAAGAVTPAGRLRPALLLAVLALMAGCGPSGSGGATAPEPSGPGTTAPAPPAPSPAVAAAPSPGCAAAPTPGSAPTPASAPGAGAAGTTTERIVVGGTERTYQLATPAGAGPAPVIVLLHGMGSSGADLARTSDLPARAAERGAVVVAPDALGAPTMWRAGGQGPDAELLDAVLADVGARHCVDTRRIGIAGFSVGALFAAAYACAHQDRIAAIVTVAVDAPGSCTEPLPVLAFHGTADPIVPFAPPPGATALGGGTGTEANLARWAQISGCGADPVRSEGTGQVVRLTWPDCAAGSEVVLVEVVGGGHEWPGSAATGTGSSSSPPADATGEAIAFFHRHARGG